eukprot:CAMPEP_0172312958 /NCGR_PEP_ID=MMETSP1058-20130122/18883_1 /TAXON_ID=83371 /ORGANISM="Detonula confervacea, Strain CCMP 353" /LENGTH=517 /DNA_ID=CAMNT_0013026527 /DNA_START=93 /DNA_END=1643 /DNA_ORIENTATION=+
MAADARRSPMAPSPRAVRLCITCCLALPTMIRAPAGDDRHAAASEEDMPHSYLRHARRTPLHQYGDGDGDGRRSDRSFVTSLVSFFEDGSFVSREVEDYSVDDERRFTTGHAALDDSSSDDAGADDEIDVGVGRGSERENESSIAAPSLRIYHHSELILDEVHNDYSSPERRLQDNSQPQWYVNWFQDKCVQSCTPTPTNPHCAGRSPWGKTIFSTPDDCCSVSLSWMSVEDCIATDSEEGEDSSEESNGMNTLSNLNPTEDEGDRCPDEYASGNSYRPLDTATIYPTDPTTNGNNGQMYQCMEGPLSLYCNGYPPNWSVSAWGGGSVHKAEGALGWKLLGDCVGEPVPEEEEEDLEQLQGNLDGDEDGSGSSPTTGSNESGAYANAPSPADGGSGGFGKPTGGRPTGSGSGAGNDKPTGGRPTSPTRPESSLSGSGISFITGSDGSLQLVSPPNTAQDQEEGTTEDTRPIPDRPDKPGGKPYKPKPLATVQVQAGPGPGNDDESSLIEGEDGRECW